MKQDHQAMQVAVASLTSKGKCRWDTNPAFVDSKNTK